MRTGVTYNFANVISNELEDGSFSYDVRYRTHQDHPWATLHCASARDAAELADRMNDLALGLTVYSPQERLHISNAALTLIVMCEGDPNVGIPHQTFQIELPELEETHERDYVRNLLARMYSEALDDSRVSTLYSDENGPPRRYERVPAGPNQE